MGWKGQSAPFTTEEGKGGTRYNTTWARRNNKEERRGGKPPEDEGFPNDTTMQLRRLNQNSREP